MLTPAQKAARHSSSSLRFEFPVMSTSLSTSPPGGFTEVHERLAGERGSGGGGTEGPRGHCVDAVLVQFMTVGICEWGAIRLQPESYLRGVRVSWDCRDETPHAGGLKQQKGIVSWVWRLEV